jgi:hypothetical protein
VVVFPSRSYVTRCLSGHCCSHRRSNRLVSRACLRSGAVPPMQKIAGRPLTDPGRLRQPLDRNGGSGLKGALQFIATGGKIVLIEGVVEDYQNNTQIKLFYGI